jgi:hypothetical protein
MFAACAVRCVCVCVYVYVCECVCVSTCVVFAPKIVPVIVPVWYGTVVLSVSLIGS